MPKTCILTPEENHAWVFAFNFYLEQGHTETQSDRLAWRDIQKEFPRLKEFDGALP